MTAPTIAERVAAGARWLDEHRPGWVDRIDLDTLDLGDPCRCVLGQEYGDYFDGPDELFGSEFNGYSGVRAFGFNRIDAERYFDLTIAWRDYIQARRDAAIAVAVAEELDD